MQQHSGAGPTLWGFERDLHEILDTFIEKVRS